MAALASGDDRMARPDFTDRIVLALALAFLLAGLSGWLNYSLAFSWSACLALTLGAVLGASRGGRLGPFSWWFSAGLVLWMAVFALMHWLPSAPTTLWFQLPPATAAGVVALWLVPFVCVTLPYLIHFGRHTLDEDALATVRRLGRNPREDA